MQDRLPCGPWDSADAPLPPAGGAEEDDLRSAGSDSGLKFFALTDEDRSTVVVGEILQDHWNSDQTPLCSCRNPIVFSIIH